MFIIHVHHILIGLVLSGHELSVKGKEELLQIAAGIEGHPDNVAPAIYGGIQLVRENLDIYLLKV